MSYRGSGRDSKRVRRALGIVESVSEQAGKISGRRGARRRKEITPFPLEPLP